MRPAERLSTQFVGSKSGTSPAILEVYSEASNAWMRLLPEELDADTVRSDRAETGYDHATVAGVV
jgi:hypothetical protein